MRRAARRRIARPLAETAMTPSIKSCRVCRFSLWSLIALLLLAIIGAAIRFLPDRPVAYDDPVEQFKYGSLGGERNMGFPKKLWQVLPDVCADYLPGKGFQSLGFIYEPGHELPVGMSERRHMGIDRVFLNCAVCHTAEVRTSPTARPMLVSGMPANQLDLMGFQKFMQACVNDRRFTPSQIVPRIDAQQRAAGDGKLGLLDRVVVYPLAVYLMRDGVDSLMGRLRFLHMEADWGPGRVDTLTRPRRCSPRRSSTCPSPKWSARRTFRRSGTRPKSRACNCTGTVTTRASKSATCRPRSAQARPRRRSITPRSRAWSRGSLPRSRPRSASSIASTRRLLRAAKRSTRKPAPRATARRAAISRANTSATSRRLQ
jgi:hypothetical protein